MMGHRGIIKTGMEFDALTPWKKVRSWQGGWRKKAKRSYNKRQRLAARREAQKVSESLR